MSEKRYWGPTNQYGPYSAQEDGWPNAGEVIRDYRKRVKKMSAAAVAQLYGEYIGEDSRITERWIQRMERNNEVPRDFDRRKALINILGVPPLLLGLGSLSDLLPASVSQPVASVSAKSVDISSYTRLLDLYWQVDHTSTAQQSLGEIEQLASTLSTESNMLTGKVQQQVFELLCGYYNLASIIYADQVKYDKAYSYADNAVTLARHMQNNKLLAVALYQRGFVRQEQAVYKGQMTIPYLQAAIDDYNEALPIASANVAVGLYMDLALVNAFMKRSAAADAALTKAGTILDRGNLYEGTFVDAFVPVDQGRYRLGQTDVFIVLKRYDDASDLIYEAKERLNPVHTRRLAWADAMDARIHFGQRNYAMAVQSALQSLKVSKAIRSQSNIHLVQSLYTQLLDSPYGQAQPVRELGAALVTP